MKDDNEPIGEDYPLKDNIEPEEEEEEEEEDADNLFNDDDGDDEDDNPGDFSTRLF